MKTQSDRIGWIADGEGCYLTVRTKDAMEIASSTESGKVYTVEIKEYRQKRSLSANAFYWSTLSELAKVLNTSVPELHNLMLRRYGQLERYGDQLVYVVLPDTDEASKKADCAETYHIKPTSQVKEGKDGNLYRTYMLLRGSSTYDTAEMSRLIDGLLSECKEVGMQVLTERERELMSF